MNLGQVVAENVRAHRARKKWKQVELAEQLGVSQRAISDLENGRRTDVGIGELVTICRVFGVSLAAMLAGAEPGDLAALKL